MENATKALIIAAGILFAILLVSVLVYSWNLYTKYQTSKDELVQIEDTAKFNAKITGYDRQDVLGYELLSLLNQIVDYNERRSEETINGIEKYPAITITIKLDNSGSDTNRKQLSYKKDNILLFEKETYMDSDLKGITAEKKRISFKQNIEDKIATIRGKLDIDDATLTSMAKNIGTIFKTEEEIKNSARGEQGEEEQREVKRMMVSVFNSYMKKYPLETKEEDYNKLILENQGGKTKAKNINTIKVNGENQNMYQILCAYYEYMQFKRGIFRCTNMEYDRGTGRTNRVTEIDFEFTGNIK